MGREEDMEITQKALQSMQYVDCVDKVFYGDCLEFMGQVKPKSIDMILTDLPYGITACAWDSEIDLKRMWRLFKTLVKDDCAIVLTASQPFTSHLVSSNYEMFKHEWIYQKRLPTNFAQATYAPMKEHESVLVFGSNKVRYYPIKEERKGGGGERAKHKFTENSGKAGEFVGEMGQRYGEGFREKIDNLRYPSSIQQFNNRAKGDVGLHPTQKPLALMEYLVKTYSREGDLVLDCCAGSGTTGVACKNLNRRYCLIDKEEEYVKVMRERGL